MSIKTEPKKKNVTFAIWNLKFDLLIHFEKQHSINENDDTKDDFQNDNKVKCEICDRYFKDNNSLWNHSFFKCDNCYKAFRRKQTLDNHKKFRCFIKTD